VKSGIERSRFIVLLFQTAVLPLLFVPGVGGAHEVRHAVSEAKALVVGISYAGGAEFSGEEYEIYPPGEETPFQVGRTDALGRVVFIPDRDGRWRIRAFSKDGHGLDIEVTSGGGGPAGGAGGVESGESARIMFGASIILAAFGLIALLYRGRRRRS
jgi:nickel transport protein